MPKFYFNKVAFPKEHGSWGFFLEPIILSLFIAYSLNGLLLAVCSFFLFLAYQPMSYIIKQTPKYLIPSAYSYLIVYLIIAGILFLQILLNNENVSFLMPFVVAILLMLIFKFMEFKNMNRNLFVEFLAPISVTLMAISIVMCRFENSLFILGYTIVLLSRSIETTLYVNNKLKFFKGNVYNKNIVDLSGAFFLIALIILTVYNITPYLSIVAILVLIIRAHLGLLEKNKNEKVKIVGIKEFIYGFLFVVISIFGYVYNI